MKVLIIFLWLFPMLAAIVRMYCGEQCRVKGFVTTVTLLELAAAIFGLCMSGSQTLLRLKGICSIGLTFRLDGWRALYACIAALMWSMTFLMAPEYMAHSHARKRYDFFTLLTEGATIGVFLANDLFTAFVFFEIMSFASYPWVAHEETPSAMRAAQTYLAVAVGGGMVTLMGLFMLYNLCGTLSFSGLETYASIHGSEKLYLPGVLTLIGFAAKAGAFPMHVWLPKAHPVAPATASALLSGILTKAGLFGALVLTVHVFAGNTLWGVTILVPGVVTMLLGAVLAVFSINIKRTLACSSLSQIGFIMVGIGLMSLMGEENALAAAGVMAHMVNHSLLKLVLFLCAGAVYMNTHSLDLNVICGFGRKKPLLHVVFLIGSLGLACIPLLNGYASKSLLHEALLEYVHMAGENAFWYSFAEKLFVFSGGLTVAYMTKLYICLFHQKNLDEQLQKSYDEKKRYLRPASAISLVLPCAILPLLGLMPDIFVTGIDRLGASFFKAETINVAYFSGENLLGALKSVIIGGIVYLLNRRFLMRKGEYLDVWPKKLDLEELLYRPLIGRVLPDIGGTFALACDRLVEAHWIQKTVSDAGMFLAMCADRFVDGIAFLFKKKVFTEHPKHYSFTVGTRVTRALGVFCNAVIQRLNQTIRKSDPIEKDCIAIFSAWHQELSAGWRSITQSVSFGLLLLCVGLLAAFVFLMHM